MVGLVAERIKAWGLDGRITAQQADAQDLSSLGVRTPPLPVPYCASTCMHTQAG